MHDKGVYNAGMGILLIGVAYFINAMVAVGGAIATLLQVFMQ